MGIWGERGSLARDEVGDGGDGQHDLSADPLDCSELDVGRIGGEVDVEDDDFLGWE